MGSPVDPVRAPRRSRRLRSAIRAVLGDRISKRLRGTYQVLSDAVDVGYRLNPVGKRSAASLAALAGKYTGERCFIIGNGPSLKRMDLRPLAGELTFALNRGYLLYDRIGGPATFLVSVNRHVIEQSGDEILDAPSTIFLSWRARDLVPTNTAAIFLRSRNTPGFSTDLPRDGIWEGSTVTYVGMQLAYYLGFATVILIGVDHAFATSGEPHRLVTSGTPDENHFSPDYFGPGYRWQLPDLPGSEAAYRLAKAQFEGNGRRIIDATLGGKLEVFPKADYRTLVGTETPGRGERLRSV